MTFCAGKKKTGAPCGGKPVADSVFCAFHDPARAKAVAAGRHAGGKEISRRANAEPEQLPALPLESPGDVVAMAKDAVNRVRSGALTPKQGTAIGSLLSAALQGMKALREQAEDEKQQGERPLKDEPLERIQKALSALEQTAQH